MRFYRADLHDCIVCQTRRQRGAKGLAALTVPALLLGRVFLLQTIKHFLGWNSRAALDPKTSLPKNSCQVREQWPAILAVLVISPQLLPHGIDSETHGLEIR